jgi:hypothetical protein
MKNPILCLAACLLLLSSCQKTAEAIIEKEANATNSTTTVDGFTKYTIPKGAHYAAGNAYKTVEATALKFVVKFDSSAIYQSVTEENQFDINKLYGFSDNKAAHHSFSARFGWSWTAGALRLYGYVYNGGKVSSKEIAVVPIGQEIVCAIQVTATTYQFLVNGDMVASLERKAETPKAQGYLLYPYFGGDEVAPHDVNIWIKNL